MSIASGLSETFRIAATWQASCLCAATVTIALGHGTAWHLQPVSLTVQRECPMNIASSDAHCCCCFVMANGHCAVDGAPLSSIFTLLSEASLYRKVAKGAFTLPQWHLPREALETIKCTTPPYPIAPLPRFSTVDSLLTRSFIGSFPDDHAQHQRLFGRAPVKWIRARITLYLRLLQVTGGSGWRQQRHHVDYFRWENSHR